jgi:hypothetical protein
VSYKRLLELETQLRSEMVLETRAKEREAADHAEPLVAERVHRGRQGARP